MPGKDGPHLGYRLIPSLVAAGLYLAVVGLWFFSHPAYEALLRFWDFMADPKPFSDLNSVLRAIACARQGVDVYTPSACMKGGVYNYSPFFLHIGWTGLGPAARFSGGLLLAVLFLAICALLPPPRGGREQGVRCLALCSSAVVWMLETANLDAAMFGLCAVGVSLLLRGKMGRALGYGVIMLGGLVKFYPAILMALALRETRRYLAVMVGLLAVGGAAYLWRYGQGTWTALAILPAGLPFRGVFGAFNLPFGLALLYNLPVLTLEPGVAQFFAAVRQPHAVVFMVIATRLLVLAGLFAGYRLAPLYARALAGLPSPERLFLVAGGLVISFCFFAAQNLDYRAAFLLLALPGLQLMAQRGMVLAVLALLWEGGLRHGVAVLGTLLFGAQAALYLGIFFWLLREVLWWWVVINLTAIVIAFLRGHLNRLALSDAPA